MYSEYISDYSVCQVDPEKAYSDCMYDYCSCQNFDPRCFCPIFSAYGDECAAKVRPQTTQTAYLLSQGGLRVPLVEYNAHSVKQRLKKYYNFKHETKHL